MHSMLKLVANDNVDEYEVAVQETQRALRRAVDAKLTPGASFGEREVAILAAANEACRRDFRVLDLGVNAPFEESAQR